MAEEDAVESPSTDDGDDATRVSSTRMGRGGVATFVFWPALIIIGAVVILTIAFPSQAGDLLGSIQSGIVSGLGWYYALVVGVFVVFAIWMGVSRFGDIKLGKDDEEPTYSLMSWFAMLFAAGMGIGLVFWGAAEPLNFATVEPRPGVSGGEREVAHQAMAQTFVHWGFHAWAVYVVVGLSLAWAIHRRGRPVSIRWALEPLLGDRVKGWIGDVIDVLAVIGTVFGIATSLGLGVQQISAGLVNMGLFDEVNDSLLVGLIVIITCAAIVSVITGIDKGIRYLSNTNLGLAGVILLLILILGPTLFMLRNFVESIGVYLQNVVSITFDSATFTGDQGLEWAGDWTIFYWGWWIAWSPFVGVFIARISRGRTVRQFVAGVLLVPTTVSFLWFAVQGGAAIYRQMFGAGGLLSENEETGELEVVSENVLFELVGDLPMGSIISVLVVILIATFFVTSSDSGSLVVDMLASGGDPNPPTWSRVLWGIIEGAVAIALLLAGGLTALQTGSIITALPFSVIVIAMCFATYRAMRREHLIIQSAERRQRRTELARRVGSRVTGDLTENFDERFGDQVDDRIEAALGGRSAEEIMADPNDERGRMVDRPGWRRRRRKPPQGPDRPDGSGGPEGQA